MARRDDILRAAAPLFAARGFHGVSIEDLGRAAGISGPGVYRHFPGKDAVLTTMLVGTSEQLLERARAVEGPDRLPRLVAAHLDFALREPELIVVQERDLPSLPEPERRRVRRVQRAYVDLWVAALRADVPGLGAEEARVRVVAVFALLNSTPRSARGRARAGAVLEALALAALRCPPALGQGTLSP
ncbi:TetR/AcrR family transcriptional regulator [Vallicoccus soli]|uniref:TetR/AcrR family transcriptional regulator n=1 Tax=Vallicoccus soli TaxID=2339232 RepID=A0A3A3Z028_9ACTN|nr:TetR/AcrR family transcriptional regulator [Vallicoccus soli]RJK96431.1 TetR/AcrR family transcriptional regulator [Vallicoccus soli]